MSNIEGVFFENQILTAKGLGAFGNSALSDGILTGCEVTPSSSNVSIDEGYIIVCGRVIRVPQTTLTIDTSSYGAFAIVATVDTTQLSTEDGFEQVTVTYSKTSTLNAATLIAELGSGYDSTNLYTYDINMSGITASTWIATFIYRGAISQLQYNYAVTNSMDLLWENTSPNTAFDSSFNFSSLVKYDAVLVTFKAYNESVSEANVRSSMICPFTRGSSSTFYYGLTQAVLGSSSDSYPVIVRQRNMYITPSTGTITFSTGWRNGSSASNAIIIPLSIHGLRSGIHY